MELSSLASEYHSFLLPVEQKHERNGPLPNRKIQKCINSTHMSYSTSTADQKSLKQCEQPESDLEWSRVDLNIQCTVSWEIKQRFLVVRQMKQLWVLVWHFVLKNHPSLHFIMCGFSALIHITHWAMADLRKNKDFPCTDMFSCCSMLSWIITKYIFIWTL